MDSWYETFKSDRIKNQQDAESQGENWWENISPEPFDITKYGAWIAPNGKIFHVNQVDHAGTALGIAIQMGQIDPLDKDPMADSKATKFLHEQGYIRAVYNPTVNFEFNIRLLTSSQKRTMAYIIRTIDEQKGRIFIEIDSTSETKGFRNSMDAIRYISTL